MLSAVCAPVARHGPAGSRAGSASRAHLPAHQAGDTLTAHPSLLVTSAGRGEAQSPHHRSWHLGFFAKLNSLFLCRRADGAQDHTHAKLCTQRAGTDPEGRAGMGLSVGTALPALICNISIV